jgi:hypothetical protein
MLPPQAFMAANPNGFPQGFRPAAPPSFSPPFPQNPVQTPMIPVQNVAAANEQLRPRIRLQAPEEFSPATQPLALPAPHALGIIPPTAEKVDWNATRNRLNQLGATTFRGDNLGPEGFRVTFLMRTSQPGRLHQIETIGQTEAAAVQIALDQAAQWREKK